MSRIDHNVIIINGGLCCHSAVTRDYSYGSSTLRDATDRKIPRYDLYMYTKFFLQGQFY